MKDRAWARFNVIINAALQVLCVLWVALCGLGVVTCVMVLVDRRPGERPQWGVAAVACGVCAVLALPGIVGFVDTRDRLRGKPRTTRPSAARGFEVMPPRHDR